MGTILGIDGRDLNERSERSERGRPGATSATTVHRYLYRPNDGTSDRPRVERSETRSIRYECRQARRGECERKRAFRRSRSEREALRPTATDARLVPVRRPTRTGTDGAPRSGDFYGRREAEMYQGWASAKRRHPYASLSIGLHKKEGTLMHKDGGVIPLACDDAYALSGFHSQYQRALLSLLPAAGRGGKNLCRSESAIGRHGLVSLWQPYRTHDPEV
jgi:hypothetical protein